MRKLQTNALMPMTQDTVITLFSRPRPYFEQSTPSSSSLFVLLCRIVVKLENWKLIAANEPVLLFLLFVTWLNIFPNLQLLFSLLLGIVHFLFFLCFSDLHLLCFLLIPCLHPASFFSDFIILQRSFGCIFTVFAFLLFASFIIEFNLHSSELQYVSLLMQTASWVFLLTKKINFNWLIYIHILPYIERFQNLDLILVFIFFRFWENERRPLLLVPLLISFLLFFFFILYFLCILPLNLDFKFPILLFIRADKFFFFILILWSPLSGRLKSIIHRTKSVQRKIWELTNFCIQKG